MAKEVLVPDVGEANDVEVIEVLVAVGDSVNKDDSLIVLESDKASMEIPAPVAGKIASIEVKVGDTVDEGDLILKIETESAGADDGDADSGGEAEPKDEESTSGEDAENAGDDEAAGEESGDEGAEGQDADEDGSQAEPEGETEAQTIVVPDVGDAQEIVVAEVLVKPGDEVEENQSVVVLESDKASMEIPSSWSGEVTDVKVSEGDAVEEGDALVILAVSGAGEQGSSRSKSDKSGSETSTPESAKPEATKQESKASSKASSKTQANAPHETSASENKTTAEVHAGPAVRKQAREYGVDLANVKGSGREGRILKEDIQEYVKSRLSSGEGASGDMGGIPQMPDVDFSKFGEVEKRPLSRVRRASARNLHRAWLNVPHVTQFDEADITDLEAFRKSQNAELANRGVKVTPLAFLVKASVHALIQYPQFNSSLDADYENLVIKKYYNIGIAVETDDGLMVPVIRNAEQKGIIELAQECADLAGKARDKKLPLDAMQGATFSISSLGGIGGTAFTPIVNAPEVAILGVSRSKVSPVWDGESFQPRTMLPLSLSYDHRAIDGAEAARFTHYLAQVLSDLRRLIL